MPSEESKLTKKKNNRRIAERRRLEKRLNYKIRDPKDNPLDYRI